MSTNPREPALSGDVLPQQVAVSSAKAIAADPRTTNALLLIMVLCISGYMPDSLSTLCGA